MKQKPNITKVENDEQGDKKHLLVLSHKGDKGNHLLRSMKKYLRKLISKKSTLQITCTGKKLSFQFNIKDKTNFEYQHDLIYHINCPIAARDDNCIVETACQWKRSKVALAETQL